MEALEKELSIDIAELRRDLQRFEKGLFAKLEANDLQNNSDINSQDQLQPHVSPVVHRKKPTEGE